MNARLQAWWGQRNRRERWLVALAAGLVLGALLDQLVFAPLLSRGARARAELASVQAELERSQAAIAQDAQASGAGAPARRDLLQRRRAQAQAVIDAAQADLIAPQQMQRELAAILERFPQLHVVGLTTLAPVAVGSVPAGAPSAPGTTAAVPTGVAQRPAGLYQHGLEITVEGRYPQLLSYLDALEHAPYRIYWRELDMSVDPASGVPVTKIGVYTLSREAAWLAL